MSKIFRTGAAALIFGLAGPSHADIIDFTDGGWEPDAERIIGGIGVTVRSSEPDGSFTEQNFDGDDSVCDELGLACDKDGIGIGDDEVSFGSGEFVERLIVDFSEEVDIVELIFLDLFYRSGSDRTAEVALFEVFGGGGSCAGYANNDGTGFFFGNGTCGADLTGVTSIEFVAGLPENSDFALAGIRTASVPEPGTLALLGIGLFGLGAARRAKIR